jgi:hypothetical protein
MKIQQKTARLVARVATMAVAFGLAVTGTAHAAQLTWTGSASTNMLDARNWLPAQLPITTDDLVITGKAVVLNSSLIVNSLKLSTGSSLSGTGDLIVLSGLTLKDARVEGTGTLTLGPGSTNFLQSQQSDGRVENYLGRVIYNSGQLTWSSGKVFLAKPSTIDQKAASISARITWSTRT